MFSLSGIELDLLPHLTPTTNFQTSLLQAHPTTNQPPNATNAWEQNARQSILEILTKNVSKFQAISAKFQAISAKIKQSWPKIGQSMPNIRQSGQISNTGQIYKKFCMGLNHCASLFSLIFEVAAFKGFKFVWFFHCGEK